MNRFFIPITATALAAGVAVPTFFGRHTIERVVTEPVQTVVREIYHETPVVYTDTVYMATEDPAPVQPVYVEEHNDYEYNEYNEYNHTDVYVHQRVVVPPQRRERGWSPREHERPVDRRGDEGSRGGQNPPRDRDRPGDRSKRPVTKIDAPVGNQRQQAPVPPLPNKPVPPKRKAPVRDGRIQVTKVQNEAPKQIPTPAVDRPVAPASEQVSLGLAQARRK